MTGRQKNYSLKTVKEVYSYWGKSLLAYRLGVSSLGYGSYLRSKAIKTLDLKPGEKIMDLACGPGIMFSRIEKRIGPAGSLIGVDYVKEMIQQCKKLVNRKKWSNVRLLQVDAAKIKLKKASLDGIISALGLSCIPDDRKALMQCHSALRKGGRIVVLDGKEPTEYASIISPLMKIVRYSRSYQRKNIIRQIRSVFGNVSVTEFALGTTFLAIAVKK